jgi:hypothetical protein
MNDFLYLFRGERTENSRLSPEGMQAQMQKWTNWIRSLSEQGKFVGGQPLQAGGKVVQAAGKVITDGPFAEGKEVVGGYVIVKVADLEEATELSKGCPIFETGGTVEVRPIQPMNL